MSPIRKKKILIITCKTKSKVEKKSNGELDTHPAFSPELLYFVFLYLVGRRRASRESKCGGPLCLLCLLQAVERS